jgi:hypothetical protein
VGFFSLFFDSPGGLQSETVDVSSTLWSASNLSTPWLGKWWLMQNHLVGSKGNSLWTLGVQSQNEVSAESLP